MKKALLCLVAVGALIILGCSGSGPGTPAPSSSSEKEYSKLYKQYSTKFHEKMAQDVESLKGDEIGAEAERIWEETFGPRQALLKQRAAEILRDLDAAPAIADTGEKIDGLPACTVGGTTYVEIAKFSPGTAAPQPKEGIWKHLLWNPLSAAQLTLNTWLGFILPQRALANRSVTSNHAGLTWEAIDRNPDKPKLALRQGPVVFTVNLSGMDGYYKVDQMRLLRPKAMKSIFAPDVTPPAEKPAAAPAATPPEKPAEKPATAPAATPAEKPAEKPIEKPAEKPKENPAEKPKEKDAGKPADTTK